MKTINRNLVFDETIQETLNNENNPEIIKTNIKNYKYNKSNKYKKWDKWFKKIIKVEYSLPEVKEYLRNTYKWVCCFCESKFEFASYPHIEHFYPKNFESYPEYITNIKNLHYSCWICNNKKWEFLPSLNEKWKNIYSPNYILNKNSNIFQLADYHPIEYNFKYDFDLTDNFYKIFSINNKEECAKNTIELLWLDGTKDRKALLTKMINVFDDALKISEELKRIVFEKNNKSNMVYFLQKLTDMMEDNSEYSTMIKYSFWEIYIKFYEIYEKELGN